MSVDNKSWKKCDIFIFQFKGLEVCRTFFKNFMVLFFTYYNLQDPSYKFPYGNKVLNKFDFNFLKRHVSSFGIPRSLLAECYILRTLFNFSRPVALGALELFTTNCCKTYFWYADKSSNNIFYLHTVACSSSTTCMVYCKERSSSTWLG